MAQQEAKWIVNGQTILENNMPTLTVSEGSTLTMTNTDARVILGGVYIRGGPYIIFQTLDGQNTKNIILKRSGFSIKGPAILKLNAYRSDWSQYRIDINLNIV
jgi:hypothetical protein